MPTDEKEQLNRQRRDQAISACCLAAAAVVDPELPPLQRGHALIAALGVLQATYRDRRSMLSMEAFRRGLHGPLGALLPEDIRAGALADVTLLDDDQLNAEAMDVGIEHLVPQQALAEHWPWARLLSEQHERKTYETLRRLSADDYVRARRLLVTSASGEVGALRRTWDRLGSLDFYEPIEEQRWRQIRGFWFACPCCAWPMRVSRKGPLFDVRCEAHSRDGYFYTADGDLDTRGVPHLEATGRRDPPTPTPATGDHLALKRAVWRYVTLPGLMELDLEVKACELGATVEMWPHKDRFDLRIELAGHLWKVDAKVWASVTKLSDALSDDAPAEPGLLIVIPDHQRAERDFLDSRIKKLGYRTLTFSGLIKELRNARRATR